MCGRYALFADRERLLQKLQLKQSGVGQDEVSGSASYNIAPTHMVPVLRLDAETGERRLVSQRWGLIPPWAKAVEGQAFPQLKISTINARAEGIAESTVYREAFEKRRCLVPASGYYEWKGAKGAKQAYYISPSAEEDLFLFAGIWEAWKHPYGGIPVETLSILTTRSNSYIAKIHHRMPVILEESVSDSWLGIGGEDGRDVRHLLQGLQSEDIKAHPVGPEVNYVRNNYPALIQARPEPEELF